MVKGLDPKLLKEHPKNRYFFDDITGQDWEDFKTSIKEAGIIEPIVIDENTVIVSGHQRVRAAIELGMNEVPVVVKEYNDEDDELRALLDTNVRQRGHLPFNGKLGRISEEYKRLYGIRDGRPSKEETANNVGSLTREDIADKLGYSVETLRQAEKLSKLPTEFSEMIENGQLSASAGARLIANMDGDEQAALFEKLRNFPQAHFTNDDIEKFKKEVQEENARRLQEMRDDFKEQMEEKEADIRAEYEGTITEQEQTIERIKAEETKRYDGLRQLYNNLREDYGKKVDELTDYKEKERERNKPSQKALEEFDTDGFTFGLRCTEFIRALSPYRYVVGRLRELKPERQKEIAERIKEVRDLMDSFVYVIQKGDSDERDNDQL